MSSSSILVAVLLAVLVVSLILLIQAEGGIQKVLDKLPASLTELR